METSYYDVDILGEVDGQGQIKELHGKEAVENSIIMWLTSFSTDTLRNPTSGGYLVNHLYKPMSESNQESIYDAIIDGFNQDYELAVQLITLSVVPDYENKLWLIDIYAYIPQIKDTVSVSTTIKNFI